jgi:hypothetical protein
MTSEMKLFLSAFTTKNGGIQTEYSIVGQAYLLLSGIVTLQDKDYLRIEQDKKSIVGIKIVILNQNPTNLSIFEQTVFDYLAENPTLDDPAKNAHFLTQKNIFTIVLESLIAQGYIMKEQKKFLFFPVIKYKLTDRGEKEKSITIESLRANILEDGEIDIDTIAHVLILDKLAALNQYFSDFERKQLKEKIEKLKTSNSEINEKFINIVSYISSSDDSFITIVAAAS